MPVDVVTVCALGSLGIDVCDLKAWERFARDSRLAVGDRGADGTLYLRMDERHHRIAVHPGSATTIWPISAGKSRRGRARGRPRRGKRRRDRLRPAMRRLPRTQRRRLHRLRRAGRHPQRVLWGPLEQRRLAFRSPRALPAFTPVSKASATSWSRSMTRAAMHFYRDLLGLRVSDFIDLEREPGAPAHMTSRSCTATRAITASRSCARPRRAEAALPLHGRGRRRSTTSADLLAVRTRGRADRADPRRAIRTTKCSRSTW